MNVDIRCRKSRGGTGKVPAKLAAAEGDGLHIQDRDWLGGSEVKDYGLDAW